MQRIRVGVTGLAAVVLIVALATAIASSVRRTANATGPGAVPTLAQSSQTDLDNATDVRTEPLAKLGVAPAVDDDKDLTVPPDKRPQ